MKACAASSWMAVVLAASLAVVPDASAADPDPNPVAVLAQLGLEDDSDGLGGLLLRGGALFGYRSHLQHYGVAAQNAHYGQDGWSENVPGIVGIYRNQSGDGWEGLRAEGGVVSVSGHARLVGDVTWSRRLRESTGLEAILAGDVVGTRAAVEDGTTYGLLGASIEQQVGARVTGILLAAWQPFTDGNSRSVARARLIFGLLPERGVSAQVRWRGYRSSDGRAVDAYFNPDEYSNWDAGVSLRRRVNGWVVSGLAGVGQERIDGASWQTTGVAELRAEGPLAGRARVAMSFLYSRAAGFAGSDDYRYGSATVSVIVPASR